MLNINNIINGPKPPLLHLENEGCMPLWVFLSINRVLILSLVNIFLLTLVYLLKLAKALLRLKFELQKAELMSVSRLFEKIGCFMDRKKLGSGGLSHQDKRHFFCPVAKILTI